MIISTGNIKIGKMSNISLTPIVSCAGCVTICAKDCYAMKAYKQYPAVKNAWDTNYREAMEDMTKFFTDIVAKIKKTKKTFFRWHVGGDIINLEYFMGMVFVAKMFPIIKFLAFTKQYEVVNEFRSGSKGRHAGKWELPANLQVVFSAWPSLEMRNPYKFPVAFMQDGSETRVDGSEIECPGSCEGCGMCWSLSSIGKNVVFHKH